MALVGSWGTSSTAPPAANVPVPHGTPHPRLGPGSSAQPEGLQGPPWALCAPHSCCARGEGRNLGARSCRRRVPRLWLVCPFGTRHGSTRAQRITQEEEGSRSLSRQSLLHLPHPPRRNNECFVPWDPCWVWRWVWEGRAQLKDRSPPRGAARGRTLCRAHCEGPEFLLILPASPTGSAGSQQTASRAEGNMVREGVRTLLALC